jgi:hypothetical protein
MAVQLSTRVRNARLDSIETTIGASAILRIRSGAAPANCAAADAGSVLATINLPADWMAAASNGSKALQGSWVDAAADAAGTAGHFRVYDSGGAVCDIQGSVTLTGNGGDMTLDAIVFTAGQQFTINTFTLNDNNG